jgi:hypothetical protein
MECRGTEKTVRSALLILAALCVAATVGCDHRRGTPTTVAAINRSAPGIPSALPPGDALRLYETRARQQLSALAEYSDETTIKAQVPASSETGQASFTETFSAPQTLAYTSVRFVGSGFVKHDVILRLLQADVEHVRRKMELETAILDSNYRFAYRGTESVGGRSFYRFAVIPRRKSPDLFKGEILLDPWTGHIMRAAGRLSKSPSLWIKHVEFSQDYADIGDFTMPTQISSVAEARIVGRVLVTIRHSAYELRSTDQLLATKRQPLP